MFKEWLQRRSDEAILRSRQFGINRGLRPEGKPDFNELVEDYKQGEQILLSRYIGILKGFDYGSNIYGLKNLDAIKHEGVLLVGNHPYQDPLTGGHCQRILINYHVDLITQKEVRWLHGLDTTSIEHFTRDRFAKQSNSIPVRDNDPEAARDLIRPAIRNRDIIGINPEGDGNKSLLRGLPKAGQMILFSFLNHYNIVCVTTDFQNDSFFLTFHPPLNSERIKKVLEILKDNRGNHDKRDEIWQAISDFAMAIIARSLPEEKRGYYHDFQNFISSFEALTL